MLMKMRMMVEVFPPGFRKLWNEWELRALVFISLASQIVLIIFGSRRKYVPHTWIKAVVWSAYLLADSVATIALGILLNNLAEIYDNGGISDPKTELTAFWAPFFLLHLGGPDTITAYSIEDNELYLRHAFQLAVQTLSTILIIVTAWNSSLLSFLAVPMIVAGCIKYGERTWTLWLASSDQLRDSMLSPPDSGPNYPKFMDEYCLKYAEGYKLKVEEMVDPPAADIETPQHGVGITSDDHNIKLAHTLFHYHRFERLFADLILSNQERNISQSLLGKKKYDDVFKVIAIELGFMYDLLYTKGTVIHTRNGLARRIITTYLTCFVLVIFSFADKQKYHQVDVYITLLLLIVATVLEIYASLLLIFSDQSKNWFIKHKKITTILKPIKLLNLMPINFLKRMVVMPRWSNSMGQFSFTSLCLEEKPGYKILKRFNMDKWEKHRYVTFEQVPNELRELIFQHVKNRHKEFEKERVSKTLRELISQEDKDRHKELEEKGEKGTNRRDLYTRGSSALRKHKETTLEWSVEDEFDQSILIWHIATELCYNWPDIDHESSESNIPESGVTQQDNESQEEINDHIMSKFLSEYMLYILVMYPFLLPVGIGLIRLRDTLCEARKFLEERNSFSNDATDDTAENCDKKSKRIQACSTFLQVNTEVPPSKVKGDRSKSVLFDACRVASALNKISDPKQKWKIIRDVWLEMLTYAASQGRGSQHARQLRRGGEFLSHVWLLMAHFGMTEQFQISEGHARASLIVE